MLKSLIIIGHLIGIFFLSFLFSDEITITDTFPENLEVGENYTVTTTITKNDVTGFAKYQIEAPKGIVIKPINLSGASFTFKDGKAKFIWMNLPTEPSFDIQYELTLESGKPGTQKNINSRFSYLVENERKIHEGPNHVLNVTGEGAVTTNTVSSGSSDISASRRITAEGDNKFLVEIDINKMGVKGFAKIQDVIPTGFVASEVMNSEAIFTQSESKVKLVWFDIPKSMDLKVSYLIEAPETYTGKATIDGKFHYMAGSDLKKVDVPSKSITIGAEMIADNNAAVNESNDAVTNETNNVVDNIVDNITESSNNVADDVQNNTSESVNTVADDVIKETTTATDNISNSANNVTDQVTETTNSTNSITESANEVADQVTETTNTSSGSLDDLINNNTSQANNTSSNVNETSDNIGDTVTETANNTNNTVTETAVDAVDATSNSSTETTESSSSFLDDFVTTQSASSNNPADDTKSNESTSNTKNDNIAETGNNASSTTDNNVTTEDVTTTTETISSTHNTHVTETNNMTHTVTDDITANVAVPESTAVATAEYAKDEVLKETEEISSISNITAADKGINYRVQIMAGKNVVGKEYLRKRHSFYSDFIIENHEGWIKYTSGSFETYKTARDQRNVIRKEYNFNGPFVSAYNDGVRITVQEALMITKQQWYN